MSDLKTELNELREGLEEAEANGILNEGLHKFWRCCGRPIFSRGVINAARHVV